MPATGCSRDQVLHEETEISISVVVPTRNRPASVAHAVRSALDQTLAPVEVVVVIDGPDSSTVEALEAIGDPRVVIVELAENGGASRARNIGVNGSAGEWVAFLDDDDEWLPGKLEAQARVAVSDAGQSRLVLGTVVEWRGDAASDWWPLRSPGVDERVADYLFVRRRPGEGLLPTPTIMLRRDLAAACPFPEHLRIHEDYDWFIELEKAGARFEVILEPLVVVHAPNERTSLSSSGRWETSLAWVLGRKSDMSRRAFSEFCLTDAARLTRGKGSLRAQVAVFAVASTGELHWFATLRFLATCLLPTETRRRAAARIGKIGRVRVRGR